MVDDEFITLLLRHETGKPALGTGRMNARHISCCKAPRFAALLRAFFAGQHPLKGRHGKRLRHWALGPSEDLKLWFANTITGWLLEAYKAVRCQPPDGKFKFKLVTTPV